MNPDENSATPRDTDGVMKITTMQADHYPNEETEILETERDATNKKSDDETEQQFTNQKLDLPPLKLKPRKINKRVQIKKLRYTGKAYVTQGNTHKEERKIRRTCSDEKCRLKCSSVVTAEQRLALFNSYWGLGNLARQREFIKSCMEEVTPKVQRVLVNKKRDRGKNFSYFFTVEGEKKRVCKVFFEATLDINSRVIRTVQEKTDKSTGILAPDMRGSRTPHASLPKHIIDSVNTHINSIPRIESHYCRKDTSFDFIEGGKTLADLHRDYVEFQEKSGKQAATYFHSSNTGLCSISTS